MYVITMCTIILKVHYDSSRAPLSENDIYHYQGLAIIGVIKSRVQGLSKIKSVFIKSICLCLRLVMTTVR